MSKIILVFINLFAIFTYNIFFGGDVTIEQKFPEKVKAGESFTIEINIEKGDRGGFAKWQQSLPEGFVATAKETAGATFSFKNQDVKIIWMAIPDDETFTISYEVTTDPEIQGDFNLLGQFSFIENNERKDISSPQKAISITNDNKVLAANPNPIEDGTLENEGEAELPDSNVMANKINEGEENIEKIEDPNEKIEEIINKEPEESAVLAGNLVADKNDIEISRKITPIEEAKYEVTLTINKGDLNSFGKIEDYLPPNYTASAKENMEGIFSFEKNVVKILWMTLPDNEKIVVKYTMESTSDELDSAVIHGAFSYLDGDDSKQLKLNPSTFENTFVPMLAEETNEPIEKENIPVEIVEEVEVPIIADEVPMEVENPIVEKAVVEEPKPTKEEKLTAEITNVPAPETSVGYKVQIAAAKKEVTQQYFIDRHNIRENVSIEFHNSWYKYTLGGYDVYKQARDKRNQIWASENRITDAFVTAYNSGDRISVQEALMITQQKWFK